VCAVRLLLCIGWWQSSDRDRGGQHTARQEAVFGGDADGVKEEDGDCGKEGRLAKNDTAGLNDLVGGSTV
jgi:hypothetical protein